METIIKKKVGLQLQLLRLERNLTQEQMSEKLNLSTSAYCKIEYGETDLTLTRLDKIAKILQISTLELFYRIDQSINENTHGNDPYVKFTKDSSNIDFYSDLRDLIKSNSKIIDLLCKRIDVLETKAG